MNEQIEQSFNYNFEEIYSNSKDKKAHKTSIIKSGLALFMALLMLISLFIPLVSCEYSTAFFWPGRDKDFETDISFNTLEALGVTINSFICLDNLNFDQKQVLAQKFLVLYQAYHDDWEKGYKIDKLENCLKQQINYSLAQNNTTINTPLVLVCFFSCLHIILSLFLTVFATIKFILTIKNRSQQKYKLLSMLLGTTVLINLLNTFLFRIIVTERISLAKVSHWQILFYVLVAICLAVTFIVNKKSKSFSISRKEILKRSMVVSLSLLILISAYMPFINTQLKDTHSSSLTTQFDASIFVNYERTPEERKNSSHAYNFDLSTLTSQASTIFYTTNKHSDSPSVFINRIISNSCQSLLTGCSSFGRGPLLLDVYAFGTISLTTTLIFALLLAAFNIYELITRNKIVRPIMLICKIQAAVSALITFAIVIFMVTFTNSSAEMASINYTASTTAAPILILLASVCLAFIPSTSKNLEKE